MTFAIEKMAGISAVLLIALFAPSAYAVGGWLELTPIGGAEIEG